MARIVLDVAREPMFLLLVAAGAVYLILGSTGDALMLLSFVLVVMGITIYQERKTERVLEALRDLTSPRALVVRDGERKRIPGREVARGDILILSEGDRVPADAALLSCSDVLVDESLLTGESVPVRKSALPPDMAQGEESTAQIGRPGGDDLPFVYSGTVLVQGQGVARVAGTGLHSEIGRIGKALQEMESEITPLQRQTGRLVRNLAVIGLSLCLLLVLLYGLTRGSWLNGLLAGITLAMAVLPEEFPVVLTVFLAVGAWRISRSNVLTRRVPAIETLGAATVLCVDKTGTITENRMAARKLFTDGRFLDADVERTAPLPEAFHELVEFAILASEIDPFDPMEKALMQLGNHYLARTEHLHEDWELVHEYSLSPQLLALSHVWKAADRDEFVVAAKGAPEAISDLCHLEEKRVRVLDAAVSAMADEGLRVLAIAKASYRGERWPTIQHEFEFQFLGLIGLADPVRSTVPEALRQCRSAGIRVVMITGDYPGTARAVAMSAGMDLTGGLITGVELEQLSDAELCDRAAAVTIFARVDPEQKLRIVEAFKANGEIVAMTGDGVNDAPALKAAHIGVAMGGRGTDVAREASALVLLDDDFASIVRAVRLGRRIFDNLKKAMAYILAVHVPIAGIALLPLVLRWPLIFMPVHIVFLELIIDPACSIVFEAEPEEPGVMERPPRKPAEPLFGQVQVLISVLQGASVLLVVLAVFGLALARGQDEAEARTLAFATMVIANLGLIFTNRSWSRSIVATLRAPNVALWWVAGGALLFLGVVLYVPALRDLFRFAPLHVDDLLVCLAAGATGVLWFEALKVVNRRRGFL